MSDDIILFQKITKSEVSFLKGEWFLSGKRGESPAKSEDKHRPKADKLRYVVYKLPAQQANQGSMACQTDEPTPNVLDLPAAKQCQRLMLRIPRGLSSTKLS